MTRRSQLLNAFDFPFIRRRIFWAVIFPTAEIVVSRNLQNSTCHVRSSFFFLLSSFFNTQLHILIEYLVNHRLGKGKISRNLLLGTQESQHGKNILIMSRPLYERASSTNVRPGTTARALEGKLAVVSTFFRAYPSAPPPPPPKSLCCNLSCHATK